MKPDITGIAPFFIVKNVPSALSFYRDRLGFDITFQGPDPEDIFFGIVQRGAAMIMFKDPSIRCRTTRETSSKASLAGTRISTSRIRTR
jgi:catechol 2,3-dioxygenase-like lactoylglutathione lyase family enzyme